MERILLAKQRLEKQRGTDGDEPTKDRPVHESAALGIAREALTLVRDEVWQLPLDQAGHERVLVVEFTVRALTGAEDQIQRTAPFAESLGKEYGGPVQSLRYELNPGDSEIEEAVAAAAGCDRILVATQNVAAYPGQAGLVRALTASGKPVLVVALRNPYDLEAFPEVKTYLAAYSYQPCALQAASEAITGRLKPTGRLPVTIPGLYPYGHGLTAWADAPRGEAPTK
ncbi:MAG: glycoside hydrolase family 3 C-terminal domain-containing protein [Syntrophothermus sp.]